MYSTGEDGFGPQNARDGGTMANAGIIKFGRHGSSCRPILAWKEEQINLRPAIRTWVKWQNGSEDKIQKAAEFYEMSEQEIQFRETEAKKYVEKRKLQVDIYISYKLQST